MSTEGPFAYRASDELGAALREHAQHLRTFGVQVEAFDRDNPGHELLWQRRGFGAQEDMRAVGFRDGEDEVPDGLSRAKTRVELRPKKSTAGRAWQDVLDRMNERPQVGPVFREFGVPETVDGGSGPNFGSFYIVPVQWSDAGEDGVIVYARAALTKPTMEDERELSPHLTPIPLSEFYAIKERLDAEREQVAS